MSTGLPPAAEARPVAAEGGASGRPPCLRPYRHSQPGRRAGRRVYRPALSCEGTAGGGGGQSGVSTSLPSAGKADLPSAAKAQTAAPQCRKSSRLLCLHLQRNGQTRRERHNGAARMALVAPRRTPRLHAARRTVGRSPIFWNRTYQQQLHTAWSAQRSQCLLSSELRQVTWTQASLIPHTCPATSQTAASSTPLSTARSLCVAACYTTMPRAGTSSPSVFVCSCWLAWSEAGELYGTIVDTNASPPP